MESITIAIADDHPVIGQGLGCTLAADYQFRLIWVADQIEKLREMLKTAMPDVLVLDIVMPGVQSINLFIELIRLYPQINIVAYTSLQNPTLVKLLYRAGVKAYVNKSAAISQLVEAISKASTGQVFIPQELAPMLQLRYEASLDEPFLSPREQEVLDLIVQERSSTEIASSLGISVNTVEFHRRRLFEKFDVKNVSGLVREAFKQGFAK